VELDRETAQGVVDFIHQVTRFHAIICDQTGAIVADSARNRIGVVHGGARAILAAAADTYGVTAAEAAASGGKMKEGFSIAVKDGGRKIGTFGISGPLATVEPVARIASELVVIRLRDRARDTTLRESIQRCARELGAAVRAAATAVAGVSSAFKQLAAAAEGQVAVSANSAEQVKGIAQALDLIRKVAAQTRMLGLNAAVEAARAGDQGRGFAVVADGVRRLAEESNQSAAEIGEMLAKFQKAFEMVLKGAEHSGRLIDEQARAAEEIEGLFAAVRRAGEELLALAERL